MQEVVNSGGLCPFTLWAQICLWVESWPSDTQLIEGFNNMIQFEKNFAPIMGLPLWSSRIVGRLELVPENGSKKMEHLAPHINEVVRRATDGFPLANAVLEDVERFATPTPATKVPLPLVPCNPKQFSPVAMTWARHCVVSWPGYLGR